MSKNKRVYIQLSDDATSKFDLLTRLSGDKHHWGGRASKMRVMQCIIEKIAEDLSLSDLQRILEKEEVSISISEKED